MESSVSNLCQPKFRILDDAQIGCIHQAVLRILDEVGVRINHPEALDKLLFCAKKRIPVNYAPALLAGSTGPVTLAGALVVSVAEALSGLVIHQLTRKGAPISSGVAATTMDMLEATVSYTSPEFRLTHSACADLFHHYGLPVWGTAGCSDSQFPDLQTGAEYAFTLLNVALDGANLIHDCGYLGQGFVASPELIIFADETIGMVKRYMRGFEIDSEPLAAEIKNELDRIWEDAKKCKGEYCGDIRRCL